MPRLAAALVASLVLAAPAFAGIADSPLPVLQVGSKTLLVYSVPGIMNQDGFNLSTFFSCTSTSASPIVVGVELFGTGGGAALNNATTSAQTVAPGGSVTFGTVGSAFTTSGATLGNPALSGGSARILSTSKSVVCTAFVTDTNNATPNAGWQLTIVAKTKQKAAN